MNNKIHLLYLALVLIAVNAGAQTSQTPIAQWLMSGNAADSSGAGIHGTMYNVTADTGRNGLPNSALFFDGMGSSYLTMPYHPSYNTPEFSLCATVKLKTFYSGTCQVNQIFYRGNEFSSGSYGLIAFDNALDNDCNNFDTTKEVFAGGISTNMNTSTSHYWQYSPTIQSYQWYSVVLTYDGSLARIFVNGVQKSAMPLYIPLGSSTAGINVGMNRNGNFAQYPYPFTGWIDDITLYNRVLSLDEIKRYDTSTMPAKVISTSVHGGHALTSALSVFPNPAHDWVNLQFTQAVKEGICTVYNGMGQLVLRQQISGSQAKLVTHSWPAGQYLLRIQADGATTSRKLVIE